VVEEHQREQSAHLRFLGGEGELAGELDRLAGQVHPARVAGRVDEVEHSQDDGKVAGLVEAAPLQRTLGPADPLRHRRLRHVEGVGDLPGGEAADGAQGQCHLGGGHEVGVAAAEEQEEGVVALLGGGGPHRSASSNASCSASSAASKSSPRRTRPASTRGTRARSAPSSSRRVGSSITPGQSSEGTSDMTSRTSIHSYSGSPPGPGSEEM
jgi:hypothetical protein